MPGTASPCKKRSTTICPILLAPQMAAVASPRKNTDPTINRLRPMASDNRPMNGETSATASTVAPTMCPPCTTVAPKSCNSRGRMACTE